MEMLSVVVDIDQTLVLTTSYPHIRCNSRDTSRNRYDSICS